MSAQQHTLSIPLDLIGEVLEYLSPKVLSDTEHSTSEVRKRKTALARCARACQALQKPALAVLWRDMYLTNAYRAPLYRCASQTAFKGYGADEDEDEDEQGDEPWNEDWPEGVDTNNSPYAYGYLDGPITAEEYARFEYYAQFVRTLRYTIRERISPTVFFFLQQHAHDRPLFPNVRELVWVHPVPEILSVLSPTIRVLRFPSDHEDSENCGRPQEIGYRMLRHTFKTLLPGMLERLPELRELELSPLRHEGFWEELARGPKARFCAQGLRSLVITEPFTVLLQGALAVISTISGLEELRITSDLAVDWNGPTRAELAALDRHDGEALRPLAKLRVLHIRSNPPAVALLMELIVAPNLEDVTLQFSVHPTARQLAEIEYTSEDEVDALHDAVRTLCSVQRSATLSSVKLMLLSFKLPERRRVSETETVSSLDALIKPLLQLHRLQDLVIDIWFIDNAPAVAMVPDMLAAWPTLQRLNIPALSLSPDDFRIAARISPELKSIRAMRLSDEFLELPGTSAGVAASATVERAPTRGHPLQDIRLYSPSKISDPANVTKIARFLCELFPRFGSTQCVGPKLARRYENQENWRDVVKQAQKIQKANQ